MCLLYFIIKVLVYISESSIYINEAFIYKNKAFVYINGIMFDMITCCGKYCYIRMSLVKIFVFVAVCFYI